MEGLKDDADPAAPGAGQLVLVERREVHAGHSDFAAGRALQAGKDRHQRGFARTRRAKQGDAFAPADVEIDAPQHVGSGLAFTERQGDIARGDHNIANGFRVHEGSPKTMTVRPYVCLLLPLQFAAGCSQQSEPPPVEQVNASVEANAVQPQGDERLVLALGDSLYAGYGVAQNESFPAVLEQELEERGISAKVVNAGVSGDTTAGGRARLAFTLDGLERTPDLALIGLGANDALRGLDPAETRKNLDAIVSELKRRGIPVVLTGMMAPRNMDQAYFRSFDPIYRELANKYGVALDPFFMEGVITDNRLLLSDGIHPNPAGIRKMTDRVVPLAQQKLQRP